VDGGKARIAKEKLVYFPELMLKKCKIVIM